MNDTVVFDSDDIDAAFAELDARFIVGEAVAYAHAWSVIVKWPTPRSTDARYPRQRRTGSTSTTGAGQLSRPAT